MSRNRRVTLRDLKAAREPGLCIETDCGKPTNGFSRLFCSQKCKLHVLYRTRPTFLRNQVFKRDRGVCALCHADTEAQRREWLASGRDNAVKAKYHVPASRDTFWDADHIVQIDQGGDWTDLANLRTLCIKCHRGETDEFLKFRKSMRTKVYWVPVSTRLPADGERVLVFDRHEVDAATFSFVEQTPRFVDDGMYINGVTHWMPMPEPPSLKSP